ncbi:MAG: class I tRNA ligase family protein, partial [Oscillospiraceae bacterium]|nr:class I tRNA ligase family protein [Oscillospiraceae bacterium]
MNDAKDYNATLNLPKTEFPMRAGLPKREPQMLERWSESNLYGKVVENGSGQPRFVLHDGPPFSNGAIHMGHALNKLIKDFVLRYKNMTGFQAPYTPGWDNHGLPVESAIIKQNKLDRKKMSVAEFRAACRDFAQKYVDLQREGFIRLGILADWDHPYLTMDKAFESREVRVFGQMFKRGFIYKGLKPVYWCAHDETSLAEAEIEYKDVDCTSIYVKFKTQSLPQYGDAYFVIWTTTPWTLPGNLAIALNPKSEYSVTRASNGEVYIVAKELRDSFKLAAKLELVETPATLTGSQLEGLTA